MNGGDDGTCQSGVPGSWSSSLSAAGQVTLPRSTLQDRVAVLHCRANTALVTLPRAVKLVGAIYDVMYLLPSSVLSRSHVFSPGPARIESKIHRLESPRSS